MTPGRAADPAERAAFLADKHALIARIPAQDPASVGDTSTPSPTVTVFDDSTRYPDHVQAGMQDAAARGDYATARRLMGIDDAALAAELDTLRNARQWDDPREPVDDYPAALVDADGVEWRNVGSPGQPRYQEAGCTEPADGIAAGGWSGMSFPVRELPATTASDPAADPCAGYRGDDDTGDDPWAAHPTASSEATGRDGDALDGEFDELTARHPLPEYEPGAGTRGWWVDDDDWSDTHAGVADAADAAASTSAAVSRPRDGVDPVDRARRAVRAVPDPACSDDGAVERDGPGRELDRPGCGRPPTGRDVDDDGAGDADGDADGDGRWRQ